MSYDDEHSVRLKAEFAFDMKLGGVMVWSVETDDFKVNFIIIICIICICVIIPRDNFNIRIVRSCSIKCDSKIDEILRQFQI